MKQKIFSLIILIALLISTTSTVFAEDGIYVDEIQQDSHKIRSKWDFSGTQIAFRGGPTPVGTEWYYEVHIKEAMYGPYSKGVITFSAGNYEIIAHVEDVKTNYAYWASVELGRENLAAAGWAEYNGGIYNFIFICAEGGLWMVLSNTPYDTVWAAESVWGGSERVTNVLLSYHWYPYLSDPLVIPDFDPKFIH